MHVHPILIACLLGSATIAGLAPESSAEDGRPPVCDQADLMVRGMEVGGDGLSCSIMATCPTDVADGCRMVLDLSIRVEGYRSPDIMHGRLTVRGWIYECYGWGIVDDGVSFCSINARVFLAPGASVEGLCESGHWTTGRDVRLSCVSYAR